MHPLLDRVFRVAGAGAVGALVTQLPSLGLPEGFAAVLGALCGLALLHLRPKAS